MSDTGSTDLKWRNLLRDHLLDVATSLENRSLGPDDAARSLRGIADADIQELDESDIEIDFDVDGAAGGPLIALGVIPGTSQDRASGNALENALSRVIRLRDRNNSLRIVAQSPGQSDLDAYQAALDELRLSLNAAAEQKD